QEEDRLDLVHPVGTLEPPQEDLVIPLPDDPIELLRRVLAHLGVGALHAREEALRVVRRGARGEQQRDDEGGASKGRRREPGGGSHFFALSCSVRSLTIS